MNGYPIALIGHGKMGRAIEQLAQDAGIDVVAILDERDKVSVQSLKGARVAIEFTQPDSAVANIKACIEAGCPVLSGTTGWYDHLDEVTSFVNQKDGTLMWAANFSLGVNLFAEIVRFAAQRFASFSSFDAHIVESHHLAKKDSPSGTALMLKGVAEGGIGREIPVTSYRVGSVPGTHEIIFDASFEQIVLTHTARDRKVFAQGALQASQWLVGKVGVFTIADMLGVNINNGS